MGWQNWPPVKGLTDIQDWDWISQIPKAIRERQWCAPPPTGNTRTWPRQSNSVSSKNGHMDSIVDNGDGSWTITCSSNDPIPSGMGFTDDGSWWNGQRRSCDLCPCTASYFVGVNCNVNDGMPWFNGHYDVIIYADTSADDWYKTIEPWQCERFRITGNTNYTLTVERIGSATPTIDNWIASGFITSLSDLNNCVIDIMREYGTSWHERWPQFPNDQELWRGDADGGKFYADGTGWLYEQTNKVQRDPWNQPDLLNNTWAIDTWVGKEVVAYDTGSNLHRLTPTSNDAQKIFFGGLTQAVMDDPEWEEPEIEYEFGLEFSIVELGKRVWPDRNSHELRRWYGGYQIAYYGHDPRDRTDSGQPKGYSRIVGTHNGPEYDWSNDILFTPCGSEGSHVNPNDLFDNDYWIEDGNYCDTSGRSDTTFAVKLYTTIRGWQLAAENTVGNFIEPIDYSNYPIRPIPAYTLAKCWYDCGINSGTTTLTSTVTNGVPDPDETEQHFTVGSAYYGQTIYYEIRKGNQQLVANGSGTADAGTGKVVVATMQPTWAGATVYYSAGWTRYFPDGEFPYMYAVDGWWEPDVNAEGFAIETPSVVDFELKGCEGVGTWKKRAKSTGPWRHAEFGYTVENAEGFVAGRYYRYVGNSWDDTTLGEVPEGGDPVVKFKDKCYEGTHHKAVQVPLRDDRVGTVTSSHHRSFTDSSKNWWSDWFNGGTLRTESGTATGGNTITLVTDATRADDEHENSCFWNEQRFELFDSPYQRFILEVDKTETDPETELPVTVTYKFPITSTSPDWSGTKKVTVTFASQPQKYGGGTVTIANGDAYRIREPKWKLNRWEDKRVTLTYPNGDTQELTVTHSDDKTIVVGGGDFDQTPVPTGTTYRITEYETGGIWKYETAEPSAEFKAQYAWQKLATNSYMVQVPPGTADRGSSIKADPKSNEPNMKKGYGRMRNGDYITVDLLHELYLFINKLRYTQVGHSWNGRGEDNYKAAESYSYFDTGDDPPSAYWSATLNGGSITGCPYTFLGVNAIFASCDYSTPHCDNASVDCRPETGQPFCSASGGGLHYYNQSTASVGAYITAAYFYADMTEGTLPTLINHSGVWYAYAMLDALDTDDGLCEGPVCDDPLGAGESCHYFNNNGSGLLMRQWNDWETFGTASNVSYHNSTGKLGTLGNVGIKTPTHLGGNCATNASNMFEGFWVSHWTFVVKWDVSGGLVYVD